MKTKFAQLLFLISLLISSCTTPNLVTSPTQSINQPETIKTSDTHVDKHSPTLLISTPTLEILETDVPKGGSGIVQVDTASFNRRDVPPVDVIKQISYVRPGGAGGGGPCAMLPPSSASPTIIHNDDGSDGDKISINSVGSFYIFGFNENEDFYIEIIRPDGGQVRYDKNSAADCGHSSLYYFEAFPKSGDPIGIYQIYVNGEKSSASTTYEVVHPTKPILGVEDTTEKRFSVTLADAGNTLWSFPVNPFFVNPGDTIEMYLAGFPKNKPISLKIYKAISTVNIPIEANDSICLHGCEEYVFEYAANIEYQSDQHGELILELLTDFSSQGQYFVLISGPNPPQCKFYGPSLSNYGDWGQTRCDIPFVLQIGDENLPTIDSQSNLGTCGNSLPSQLKVDDHAYVSLDPPNPNTLRQKPGKKETKVGKIQPGQEVKILEGPTCVDGLYWWKVKDQETNLVGWTAEGDDINYWLIPIE